VSLPRWERLAAVSARHPAISREDDVALTAAAPSEIAVTEHNDHAVARSVARHPKPLLAGAERLRSLLRGEIIYVHGNPYACRQRASTATTKRDWLEGLNGSADGSGATTDDGLQLSAQRLIRLRFAGERLGDHPADHRTNALTAIGASERRQLTIEVGRQPDPYRVLVGRHRCILL